MNIFNKIWNIFFLDKHEKQFVDFAKEKWRHLERSGGELLIDVMSFPPYIFQSAYLCNFFSSEYDLTIHGVFTTCDVRKGFIYKHFFPLLKLGKIYLSFGCELSLVYSACDSDNYFREKAKSILSSIDTKEKLVRLEVEGLRLGDLIYDSYLRKYQCATVTLNDSRLVDLLRSALIIHATCKRYLDSHNVRVVLLSHAVYIEYGILARLSVQRGIPVYLFSKWNVQVVHKLTAEHFLQTSNHLTYKKKFTKLEQKEKWLKAARNILLNRFSGEIDSGTSYMKHSAYSPEVDNHQRTLHNNNRPRVLVMLHCFYDSPHIYRDMLFADFYDWLHFTLTILELTEFDIYVKPHPNGLPGNESIVREFEEQYINVSFLDKKVANNQLVAEGIDAVVTVYGTVGHEFSYQGIPVICAGDNPHAAYDFCYFPSTQEAYAELLYKADQLEVGAPKTEIEEFVYMHYMCPGEGRLEGNNDLFGMGRPAAERSIVKSSVFSEFIESARDGAFDDVPEKLRLALNQVASH